MEINGVHDPFNLDSSLVCNFGLKIVWISYILIILSFNLENLNQVFLFLGGTITSK